MSDPLALDSDAFARLGVSITPAQREQVALLLEEGRVSDAQQIILREIQRQAASPHPPDLAWLTQTWVSKQLREAYSLALQSPDPSTQNGAIVFNADGERIGSGYNEFTRDMPITADLLERPKKYAYIEHAERNSLYDVLRYGAGVPYVMVVAWAACSDCARAIVQSGVRHVVRHVLDGTDDHTWRDSIADGDAIMAAAGVNILTITGPLGGCAPVLRNGSLITP